MNGLTNQQRPTTRVTADGQTQALFAHVCSNSLTWFWIGQTNASALEAAAWQAARAELPDPSGVFAPDVTARTPAVVNLPLHISVARWAPVAATATVPGLSATATATPARLLFVPGDGSPTVVCPGAPTACTYTYRDASTVAPNGRTWPAQLQVLWNVRWVATNGDAGALAPITTTTDYAVPVGEIETVEQGG